MQLTHEHNECVYMIDGGGGIAMDCDEVECEICDYRFRSNFGGKV